MSCHGQVFTAVQQWQALFSKPGTQDTSLAEEYLFDS